MKIKSLKIRSLFSITIMIMVTFFFRPSSVGGASVVNTDKDIYNYGEMIKVNFFNAPGYERDWICIVPADSPDNEPGDYKYMPPGLNQGILTFNSPSPGKYEVRAYYNYSIFSGYVVSARHGFSVVAGGPHAKAERSSPTKESSPAKEEDVNFIPAPKLSTNNFNKLWSVAKMKCYDFGWSIANDDKETKNLICQTQSSGSAITLRVKFADEGVYIDLQMSTLGWSLFGGKGMASKATEHREMKKALQKALSEIQSSRKEIVGAEPIINQQVSNETRVEKLNGTQSMENKPALPEKTTKSIIKEQIKTESLSPSMTIAQIQKRLSELGYQPGPSDGNVGKKTIEALKKFQQDNNLQMTGKADNETVNKLQQKTAKDKKEQYVSPRKPKAEAPTKAEPVKAPSPKDKPSVL